VLGIGKKVKLRGNVMEDGGIDYMHLGSYGEIIICEEILKKRIDFLQSIIIKIDFDLYSKIRPWKWKKRRKI